MLETIQTVREIAPHARLDCCPYEDGDDNTGYFIRIGVSGHWISKVRKNPRAAWANAATRMRAKSTGEPERANGVTS